MVLELAVLLLCSKTPLLYLVFLIRHNLPGCKSKLLSHLIVLALLLLLQFSLMAVWSNGGDVPCQALRAVLAPLPDLSAVFGRLD